MISPNCPVIMDAASTTSAYNTIERNAHNENMRSNVGDQCGAEELIENELLDGLSHDPDDEDTLSDDSLRLRLSDDEADASQTRTTDKLDCPSVPYVSSEQTTSEDTVMGLTESDEKVTNKECQRSKHHSQILSETHVGGKKNIDSMWRGGSHREHPSNNTIHLPKLSLRGHSLHVRYNHSQSNVHRSQSYFNNQDNYGKPSTYRKYKSNWRHSKGKYLHGNTRNVQRNAVKEEASNPKSESGSRSNAETDLLVSNQPSVCLPDSVGPATVECRSENENPEQTLATAGNETSNSLPSVNDELSRECNHLNLDKETTSDSKSSENLNLNHSNWKNHKDMSQYGYDSEFTSDDWFDEPCTTRKEYVPSPETSSPLLSQGSSDFQGIRSASPVKGIESAVHPEEEKNETAIDDPPFLQSSNLSSLDLAKDTTESELGSEAKDIGVESNTVVDSPSDIHTRVDADDRVCEITEELDRVADSFVSPEGRVCETTEELDRVADSSVSPEGHDSEIKSNELSAVVACSEGKEISEHEGNDVDEIEEGREENVPHADSTEQDLTDKENVGDKEKIEGEKTEESLSDGKKVEEQPMEIVTEAKDTGDDMGNRDDATVSIDITRRTSSDNEPKTKVIECAPENLKTLENIEEQNEKNTFVCNEISDKSSDSSEVNLTQKSSFRPDSDMEAKTLLLMKRRLPDSESVSEPLNRKKIKITPDSEDSVVPKPVENPMAPNLPGDAQKAIVAEKRQETPSSLNYVRKFFQRDMKGKLAKLKREELEEFIIQKLVETITMRSEIGRLREQARISERNQEATRVRCQQLAKQIKDFDMVLSRNAADRRANNDKPIPPIKINRSVGLQVNFVTEHGIQSLRALSMNNAAKPNVPSPVTVNGGNAKMPSEKISHTTAVRRGLKVRSPRRAEVPKNPPLPVQPQVSTATPAALVVCKPADTSHNLSIPNNNKEPQPLPSVNLPQPAAPKLQNILLNGKIAHPVNRPTVLPNNPKPRQSNDLIDLTEEEDKNRSTGGSTLGMMPIVGTVTSSIATKLPHPRFQRVVAGPLPGNVALTTQSANIRVLHSVAQPTPTALVNNINTTRLAYVMQGASGTGRQLYIAPNPNQIRPVVSTTRAQYSNVTYKSGISTLANGNVRVITTAAPTVPNSQPPPAPLPETPHYPAKNGWKLPPPPPSLKISKVPQGIVLSWNMAQSDSYADIASYQLYAYQEIPGTPPNSNLWKKVGDVRALPLPMACTLKEFTPGNNYHFAVRAVDTHSRLGQYSIPRNISL